jgi:putative ABC transport system substrate-binding protein
LHELVPAARSLAYLVNPANAIVAESETREMHVAARNRGVSLLVLHSTNVSEFEAAFATLVSERAGGLVVGTDILFLSHPERLAALAARHQVPTIYRDRNAVAASGLLSYGTDLFDARRRVGLYTGRILKGEKAAELPVQQVTKTHFAINLKTARALGLEMPPTLLARADEVIE